MATIGNFRAELDQREDALNENRRSRQATLTALADELKEEINRLKDEVIKCKHLKKQEAHKGFEEGDPIFLA